MKFRQSAYSSFVILSTMTCFLHSQIVTAATTTPSAQSGHCLGVECNPVSLDESETPGAIAEREGAKMADAIRKNGSDDDQWKSFILHSDSRNSKELSITLVKSEGFSMRLEPITGLLHFQKRGSHQAFAIAAPARLSDIWAKQELCPAYAIKVLSASSSSAVIVKYCKPYTDFNGNNFTSEEYYLYDAKTTAILALWFSSTGDNSIPGPFVTPPPTVNMSAHGYEIKWKFHDATNPSLNYITMRNNYDFEFNKKTKSFYLRCTDLTSHSNSDGNMCDGPANLKLIKNEIGR